MPGDPSASEQRSATFGATISTHTSTESLFFSSLAVSFRKDGVFLPNSKSRLVTYHTNTYEGRQITRATTTRGPASPLRRNWARRHDKVRVDIQYPARQLRELCRTPTAAELYGYWHGGVQGEGSRSDD